MLKYLYIDESGDLGGQSKYLVLAALIVDNPVGLDRIIKNMRRHKFRRQLRKAQEIKANKSSKQVIVHMLKSLNSVKGVRAFYIILEKRKLRSTYLQHHKNKLYNYVAGKLARQMVLEAYSLEVRIDRSQGKQLLQEDFNKYFERSLRDNSSIHKLQIFHSWSHSWSGLQFADVLAWSVFQKFEHGNNEYVDVLDIPQEVYQVW